MSDFQRDRDEQALPRYAFATELGTLAPPPPEVQQVLASIHGDAARMDDFASVVAGSLSPVDFFTSAGSLRAAT